MTDFEMTKLCAEAMRIATWEEGGMEILYPEVRVSTGVKYRPLHDDAQAMALVKTFNLDIQRAGNWHVVKQRYFEPMKGKVVEAQHKDDLNRAIVECVARMQELRPKAR